MSDGDLDKRRLDWLDSHKSAEFTPLNTTVPRHASRVGLIYPEPSADNCIRRIKANSVREAIDLAMEGKGKA